MHSVSKVKDRPAPQMWIKSRSRCGLDAASHNIQDNHYGTRKAGRLWKAFRDDERGHEVA